MAEERLIFPVGFDLQSGVKSASEEWKRVQKQMQAAIDSRPISVRVNTDEINKFNTYISRTYASLENLQKLFPQVFKQSVDGTGLTNQLKTMKTSINAVNAEMRNLEMVWNNLSMTEKFDKNGNLTAKAQQLKQAYVELYKSQQTQGKTLSEITKEAIALADKEIAQAEQKKRKEEEFLRVLKLEETSISNIRAKQSAWMSKLSTAKIGSNEWKQSLAEVKRLDAQLKKLQTTIKGTKTSTKIDIDTGSLTAKLQNLENRWRSLTAAQRRGVEGQALIQEWRKLAAEAGNYASTLRSAANAQDRLSNAQKRSVAAIKAQNVEYQRQGGYITRLIQRFSIYTAIFAGMRMIKSIRDVTAEFQLQKVALSAIIKDAHQASVLFSQIKAAAIQSPFQIKELVSYTKQLAAYGFEQKTLFETTMRLADISAGLGADMSRIILAVGQISAASVLKGTELRQLTELGLPMVELLSKKFSALRGEVVSTADIFEMISDKAISFKVVEEVLNDLTNAGGMFYEMQKKQAETLAGQWSNLKDTISIAYNEIGNTRSVSSAMTNLIGVVKTVADRWSGFSNVIGSSITLLALYGIKNKLFASSNALTVASLTKRIKTEKALEAQIIKTLARNRALTTSEQRRLLLSKNLTRADYARIIQEQNLSKNQAVRLALANRNNKALMTALVRTKLLTKEEAAQIVKMNALRAAWARFRLGMIEAGITMQSIGAMMKTFLPIAIITTVIQLISQYVSALRDQSDAIDKVNKAYLEQELELDTIQNIYDDLNQAIESANASDETFAQTNYSKKIEQLQKISKILDKFGLGNAIDFSVLNADNIDSVFNTWTKQLRDANSLSRDWGGQLALVSEAFEGNVMGWSLFGENLKEDMKDLTRSYNALISDKQFLKDLARMREYVKTTANSYQDIYKIISEAVGEDAKLALGQKRRNESEYQYQMRIMENYEKIRVIAAGATDSNAELMKRLSDGSKAFFSPINMTDYYDSLSEVMQEFESTLGFFENQDPVTIRMAIDDQWALNEWADWQKDAFIAELNKERIKLGLEIIPVLSSDSIDEVQKGWKSILATEFPTFFDKEELSNMYKLSDVVGAIEEKMKQAADEVVDANKSVNKMTKDSESYKKVLAAIDAQQKIINEEKAKGEDADNAVIQHAYAQIQAISQQNTLYDEQIAKRKEMAKAEFDLAKSVKDRLLSDELSLFGKDFKIEFPELTVDEFKELTDANYNTDFLVSDEELKNISSVLDIYDLWEKNTKAIADAREKIYGLGISEEKIAEEQAKIDARRAQINQELADVNQRLTALAPESIEAKRKALALELSQTTDAKERMRIIKETVTLSSDNVNAESAKLAVKKQVLEASLNEVNNAEAINKSIEEYVSWLNKAEGLWEKIKKKFNFNPLSGLAQDISNEFPDLLASSVKGAKGVTVPIDFYLSDKDLQGIWNAVDVAGVFETKIKAIEEEINKANKTKLDPAIDQETIEYANLYASALELVYQNLLKAQARYVKQYSDISKDVQTRFPKLMETAYKGVDRETYSTKGLFSQEELRNMEDYIDLYALWEKKLTGVTKEIENYNKQLDASIDATLKSKILSIIGSLEDEKKALEELGKAYGFVLKQKGREPYNDDWLILWKNRMSFMKDFQKGVEDLSKKMKEADALSSEKDIMRFRGKSVKIDVETLTGSPEELSKWYDTAIDEVMKKIRSKGGKPFEGLGVQAILAKDTKSRVIKAYQELLQELFNAKTDFETKQLEENLKKEIDRLATAVSRSKQAKDFYDKMLGMTGNEELAANLTMNVYGGVGTDLKKNIKEQLEQAFKDIDISGAFDGDKIDYRKLEAMIPDLPEDLRANARRIVEEGIKDNATWLQDLYKTYEKFQTYEERRTAVMAKEAQKRKEIEASVALSPEEKEKQIKASQKREAQSLDTIDLEEFKASEDWIQTFENIDKVGTKSIQHLMVVLKEFIDTNKDLTPEQIKTLMSEYEKLYQGLIERNPLKAITDGTKEYFAALKDVRSAQTEKKSATQEVEEAKADVQVAKADLSAASNDYERAAAADALFKAEERLAKAQQRRAKAETSVRKAQDKQRTALNKVKKGVDASAEAYNALGEVVNGVMETFNIDETSKLGVALTSVSQALTMVAGVLGIINAMITLIESHPLVLAISAGIMAIIAAIMLFKNLKTADAEAKIEAMTKKLEELEYAYEKLEKAQEKAFGSDYIENYNQRMKNLFEQQQAYLAQAEAERSKGKQADEEKVKDYEKSAREAADGIADAQTELSEHFLGTDLTSAARDFAQAWIDAYKEFGSTTDAMEEKFSEMIENMIVESLAAKVIESQMKEIFDMVDSLSSDGQISVQDAALIAEKAKSTSGYIDAGMNNLMSALETAGISVRGMGSDLTGISKDIASASEESILGLAAGINTQNFYISQVPPKLDTIIAILQGGNAMAGINVQDLITIQNQHLAHLPNIATNTLNTADRCERAAVACESALSKISSVISVRGTTSTHVVNMS